MLFAASALRGYAIEASDGQIGTVKDILFDDTTWKVRWLDINAGSWLTGRKVLIHPSAIVKIDYVEQSLSVNLTMAKVKASPNYDHDRPVSRQMESSLCDHYSWDPVWGGVGVREAAGLEEWDRDLQDAEEDPHLRSAAAVAGYHVHANDGAIGHVEDLLVDDRIWGIRYLIIDTSNWWSGQRALMSPHAVRQISWKHRQFLLDVNRDQVKAAPQWNPSESVDETYEKRLHSHYSWPGMDGDRNPLKRCEELPSLITS
jgi:sporulation protein YlmC with PRC-barrel domain